MNSKLRMLAAGTAGLLGAVPTLVATSASASAASAPPTVGAALTPDGQGYVSCASDGGVFTHGDAHFAGSMGGRQLNAPIVGCATDPATGGYWLVGADGGVFAFGAPFLGSTGAVHLNQPIVGMAATPDGGGYWLVAADGGVFSFGDARFWGSTATLHLNAPVVGIAATPDGGGYWLAGADGGVFGFGDARFLGSATPAPSPVIGITATAAGYVLASADGALSGFGAAAPSVPLAAAAVVSTPGGQLVEVARTGQAVTAATGAAFYSSPPAPTTAGPAGSATPAVAPAVAPAAAPPPATTSSALRPSGPGGTWTLAFDDEFNGSSLDTSKWSTGWFGSGITPPVNSNEQDCYDPNQVSESGGTLNISVAASPCTVGGHTYPYRSGLVSTNGKAQFTYGFFEARIYTPGTNGQIANWPAWWTDGQSWPADGEMDILEGLEGQACWHFHSPAGGPGSCAAGDFTGWHTYGADWEPGSVTYYYDGRAVGTITTGITSAPMYLVLTDAVNAQSNWPASAPSTMRVDYVRVWTKG